MSNFLRTPKRLAAKAKNKEIKYRTKDFYSILGELNEVALELIKKEELSDITKENIKEFAKDYTNRIIGKFETSILWAKLEDYKNRIKQRDEVKGDIK